MPLEVVEYVCAQAVEVVEDRLGPLGRQGDRMIRRCRELVRERTGAVWDPWRVRGVAESAMRVALLSEDNPADVINVALKALSGHGCELPAYSGEHGAHSAGGVGLFPGGLEQERRFFVLRAGDVQGEGLFE